MGIVSVIAGIVLRANPDWFNGAHTIGTVLLIVGIAICVVKALFFALAALAIWSDS